jgi:hypothetical protein
MIPSAGDAVATGNPPGVDLSDIKFAPGGGDEPGGTAGIDLSNVLFLPGAAVEEDEEV